MVPDLLCRPRPNFRRGLAPPRRLAASRGKWLKRALLKSHWAPSASTQEVRQRFLNFFLPEFR